MTDWSPEIRALPSVEFDAWLAEECVALSMRRRADHPYWDEHTRIYELPDEEKRERAFVELGRRLFRELDLAAPLRLGLEEQPIIAARVGRCRVAPARSRKDEGAELFVPGESDTAGENPDGRSVVLRVLAETVLSSEDFLALARHELYHIADMLDPAFDYDPTVPRVEGGPMLLGLVLSRYRALWDTAIDGRLWRKGRASSQVREKRLRQFSSAFPMFGERSRVVFDAVFDELVPTHAFLLSCARDPARLMRSEMPLSESRGVCPLCGAPAGELRREEGIPAPVVREVLADSPEWCPADGICAQCAELYRARPLSRAEERRLPGARPADRARRGPRGLT